MLPELNEYELTRAFDSTKSELFTGGTGAFFGSLACGLDYLWMDNIPTAQTDGTYIGWNPHWYLTLEKPTRVTVLMHEIWHVARLHILRRMGRDPKIWNYACDLWINNTLERNGYSFRGVENCWKDQQYWGLAEEEIYDQLIADAIEPPPGGTWGFGDDGDLEEPNESKGPQIINNVVKALYVHQAGNGAGNLPGDTEIIIKKFLEPVVPWEAVLFQFFSDLLDSSYTWSRPNRRYTEMYLPSSFEDDGRLEHLCYYLDVSGSITRKDVIRFNSEVKYIWEHFQPKKLTMVLFDVVVQKEFVFNDGDLFEEIRTGGGGGTSFECVRQHINEHKPTAAIVFSDMDCAPMGPLDYDLPVIWIATRAAGTVVPFGKLIHIRK